MTLAELISRTKGLRTLHGDSLPPPGPARESWRLERELLNTLLDQLTTRLNESREARA